MVNSLIQKRKWDVWWVWQFALWIFRTGMLVIWGLFYCQVYGETPYGPWPVRGMDVLFGFNFLAIVILIFRSRNDGFRLPVTLLNALIEFLVAWLIWEFGGMSVSGFYL
jgi:hypothetical protein